jgi:hypothetical protein
MANKIGGGGGATIIGIMDNAKTRAIMKLDSIGPYVLKRQTSL